MVDEEIRLILIGKTGSGKSSSGNAILGSNVFKSSPFGNSQTEECSYGFVKRDGKSIMVIDTPGLFGTDKSENDIKNEIIKSVYLAAPGPHAVIYVFPVGERYTSEEQKTIHMFYEYFGKQLGCYILVLFTRKDVLVRRGIDEKTYLSNLPHGLDKFVLECSRRTVFFDNTAVEEEKEKQVAELLENVDSILQHNGQGYYTSQLLNEAEKEMRQRDEKFLKDNETIQQKEEKRIKESYREQLELEVDKQKRAEQEKAMHDQLSSLNKSWEEKARDDSRLFIAALGGSILGGALIAGLSYEGGKENQGKIQEVDKQKRAELEKEMHYDMHCLQKSWGKKARDDSRWQMENGLFIGALLLFGACIAVATLPLIGPLGAAPLVGAIATAVTKSAIQFMKR